MGDRSAVRQTYAEQFAARRDALPGARVGWLADLRRAEMERFVALGLPTPKTEAWKYTNLRALEETAFSPAAEASVDVGRGAVPDLFSGRVKTHRFVFVNGRYRADLSRPGRPAAGLSVRPLAEVLETDARRVEGLLGRIGEVDGMAFYALNTAFVEDGCVISVDARAAPEAPVEIVHLGTAPGAPLVYYPRTLVVAEPESRVTVIEHHAGLPGSPYFADGATEVQVGEGAIVRHLRIQDEAPGAFHVWTVQARVGRGAAFENFALLLGGGLSRNEITVTLEGRGGRCVLDGAYLGRGRQHMDTATVIDHAAPETGSREIYKGVLDEKARAVFRGKIAVRRDAQKIDGHQLNKTLLLSEGAEIDTKPELEINADDVKCSHGATAGEIDRDALFYLRARGIAEDAARDILVQAFLSEVIEKISDAHIRQALLDKVAARLTEKTIGEQG